MILSCRLYWCVVGFELVYETSSVFCDVVGKGENSTENIPLETKQTNTSDQLHVTSLSSALQPLRRGRPL